MYLIALAKCPSLPGDRANTIIAFAKLSHVFSFSSVKMLPPHSPVVRARSSQQLVCLEVITPPSKGFKEDSGKAHQSTGLWEELALSDLSQWRASIMMELSEWLLKPAELGSNPGLPFALLWKTCLVPHNLNVFV